MPYFGIQTRCPTDAPDQGRQTTQTNIVSFGIVDDTYVTQVERACDLTDANFDLDLGDLLPMPMLDLLIRELAQQVL